MNKEAFKQWKYTLKEEHLQIKLQNRWFEELKKTDLYHQQRKYNYLKNSSIFFDYFILTVCYLSLYMLPVSELNAFLSINISQNYYRMIVQTYSIIILFLDLFVLLFLLSDNNKTIRIFTIIIASSFFGGMNLFLLTFAFTIQPLYYLAILFLIIVKLGIKKRISLQKEVVLTAFEKAEKKDMLRLYKYYGIRFEMKDEPYIYRDDCLQRKTKKGS